MAKKLVLKVKTSGKDKHIEWGGNVNAQRIQFVWNFSSQNANSAICSLNTIQGIIKTPDREQNQWNWKLNAVFDQKCLKLSIFKFNDRKIFLRVKKPPKRKYRGMGMKMECTIRCRNFVKSLISPKCESMELVACN